MPDFRLLRSVVRPHRNLSPWIGGGLLAVGGLASIIAIALTPVRPVSAEAHTDLPVTVPVTCDVPDADEHDPARWTIGPGHFGPLVACRPITVASVREMLPDYTVVDQAPDIVVASGETPVLRILRYPATFEVIVATPLVATPWGIRVGDRVRDLRVHHPDLECRYGSLDGDDGIECHRAWDPHGWDDSFRYALRMADLPAEQQATLSMDGEDAIDLDAIADMRIESIHWSNG